MSTPLSKPGFIYEIVNTVTGGRYVGQSLDPKARWIAHKSAARRGANNHIYSAMRKHGVEAFTFTVISGPWHTQEEIDHAEILFISHIDVLGFPRYNISDGGGRGDIESAKAVYAEKLKDPDYISVLSKRASAMNSRPDIRAAMKARAEDPVMHKQFSDRRKAFNDTPEFKAATKKWLAELHADPEYVAALRKGHADYHADPVKRAEFRDIMKKANTPEVRAKRTQSLKASWADPERRATRSRQALERNAKIRVENGTQKQDRQDPEYKALWAKHAREYRARLKAEEAIETDPVKLAKIAEKKAAKLVRDNEIRTDRKQRRRTNDTVS